MQYLLALLPILASVAYASPVSKRATNQVIQSANSNLCISPASGAAGVANGNVGNDVTLVSIPCEDAATWDISRGSGSIILDGTNYAIDAGENPGDNGALKVSFRDPRTSHKMVMKLMRFRFTNPSPALLSRLGTLPTITESPSLVVTSASPIPLAVHPSPLAKPATLPRVRDTTFRLSYEKLTFRRIPSLRQGLQHSIFFQRPSTLCHLRV